MEAVMGGQAIKAAAKPRFATAFLALSMFVTGACGLVAEYILSTVCTYILGNSIEQFSVTISLMMFMMGVAAYAQRFMGDGRLIEKFILIECLIALTCAFSPIALYAAFAFMTSHFALVQYFFVCSLGFMIGLEIPLVLRINEKYSKTLGINMANVYSPDYVGSFVGALVWTFWLFRSFPLTEVSFLMAGVNFAVAVCALLYFVKHNLVKNRLPSFVLIAATAAALIYGYASNLVWSDKLEQRLYDDKIVFAQTTRYQRLVMTYRADTKEYRFYINGNLQFSSADEAIYHEQLVHPVMSLVPDHRRVLILGGGDGMALREVLKYPDVEQVTLVDIDPDMVKFCANDRTLTRMNRDSFADARVKIFQSGAVSSQGQRVVYQENGQTRLAKNRNRVKPEVEKIAQVDVLHLDADRFIGEVNGKWNVVIIDFPDPNAIELAKLYSKEFFLKVERILAESGLIAIQATSPYHAKESYLCVRRTMAAAGFTTVPYHDNVPSFGDWGWFLAAKNKIPEAVLRERISRLREFPVETRYLTPEVLQKALVFGRGWLRSEFEDINTLMHPVLLQKYVDDGWKME